MLARENGSGSKAKWTLNDSGKRVPVIVSLPEKIEPGVTSQALISFVDVLPTMVEIAGGKTPKAPGSIDGESFMAVLQGRSKNHHRYVFGAHTNRGIHAGKAFPLRSVRDEQHKLILNLCPACVNQNTFTHHRDWQPRRDGLFAQWLELAKNDESQQSRLNNFIRRPEIELFDLKADPWEQNNLAGDPELLPVIATLRAELESWMLQQGDKGLAAEIEIPLLDVNQQTGPVYPQKNNWLPAQVESN